MPARRQRGLREASLENCPAHLSQVEQLVGRFRATLLAVVAKAFEAIHGRTPVAVGELRDVSVRERVLQRMLGVVWSLRVI